MSQSNTLTLEQLQEYDGINNEKIYVAISGEVYDVSSSDAMYGKNGRYNVLAGKDATYALATMNLSDSSFDPIHMKEALSSEHLQSLETWIKKFKLKYQVVGQIESSEKSISVTKSHESGDKACPFSDKTEENSSNPTIRCPLGFDRKKSKDIQSLPKMTLQVLKMHSGSNKNMPKLISVKGRIYDISRNEQLLKDSLVNSLIGREASRALAEGVFDEENFDKSLDEVGIEGHLRLEKYFKQLEESSDLVAILADDDYEKFFGSNGNISSCNKSSSENDIHIYIEGKDMKKVKEILAENNESANGLCPRTGLSALHKAVEVGSLEIAEILLENGANTENQCALYDGDTPLQLAKRLNRSDMIEVLERK